MVVEEFLSKFDPKNKDHVEWFKHMIEIAENVASHNIEVEIMKNPMKIKFTSKNILDWPQIHCLIGTKYAKSVLCHEAYIPA
jgi:hypothetical protein